MDASFFIAGRLRFRRKIVTASVAISFLVMIIAVAISSGFRHEIREGLSVLVGDIQLTPPDQNVLDESSPIEREPAYLSKIEALKAVEDVYPAVYKAGVIKHGDNIHGVLFKAVPEECFPNRGHLGDSISLPVSIPSRLAEITGLKPGDKMLSYFVGEKVKMRQFNVVAVHELMLETDDNLLVYADIADMQRVLAWNESEVSALEIKLKPSYKSEKGMREATMEIGTLVNAYSYDSEHPVIATSSLSKYPQIFDWVNLIDFNVFFILLLMTIVAGFNMISGLLIMLFENISTIGLLKALGMTDRAIAKVFLSSSAVLTAKGMLIGNALAFLFCIIQATTHIIPLNPENYFVSYVPVYVNVGQIFLADLISFIVIMVLLLIPCHFISKVDPAESVRVK